ncbi:AAA family ATPase [Mesorhizobium opportunistum]|uniref:AAA ATPase n=1 Tax=Mesorhizobium opportunistum (strain LMG 24607 / HAMBI 3007 / WSM2075) TaxID=536019 RepID=F7YAU0_MESOW|nr:AAA family ATPase [Mesorhizobium opportunistum]AEH89916.1 AAA ATPase [Mesorhizobium opportunistum WSM2075]
MSANDANFVYYCELRLSNVKAFTPGTVLDLRLDGRPAPWTLILGENGLGKTTLLQCLALMRPILNVEQSGKTDARPPDRVEPALPIYDDNLLVELARIGDELQVELEAEFSVGRELRSSELPKNHSKPVTTGATFRTKQRDLSEFEFTNVKRRDVVAPLLVAYSAARHPPYRRSEVVADHDDPAASLFNPEIELADAVQVLENLDHLTLRKDKQSKALYVNIKSALAEILPEIGDPKRIHVYGPPSPSQPDKPSGVWIETYSGEVPLQSLSVGYQTMFAWTVDLAWRMAQHHTTSEDPLREPAIVLIDELDLHLHPKWQRRIRRDLSKVFPRVQFIVTTHSPVLAQTYLDTNIAVVKRDGDHASIDNDPKTVSSWRLDQVSVSLLHDLDPYSPEIVEAFQTRRALLGKKRLNATEKARLNEANILVAAIPSELDPDDLKAAELIREAAHLLATRPK